MQADVWYRQLRLEDAEKEALHSVEIFEKIGAAEGAMNSKSLQKVQRAMKKRSTRLPGGLLEIIMSTNFRFLSYVIQHLDKYRLMH